MKPILRLAFIFLVAVAVSSCSKVVDRPYEPPPSNPLKGSWIVSATDESDEYGWKPFSSGLENGIFYFYNNGTVQYNDNNVTLTGSWDVNTTANGFYDEYGNFFTGIHQSLETHMTDSYSDNTLNLYFDYISFENSNLFVATYYDGKYVERFTFSRY